MGQAKNRSAEIAALKAKGPKNNTIRPFLVRGTIVANTSVSFDTTGLDANQVAFVESCERTINTEQIPSIDSDFSDQDSVAFVMYQDANDFSAALLVQVQGTPDSAYQQLEDLFNQYRSGPVKPGDFIPLDLSSQKLFPNLKEKHKVQANNDWFKMVYNSLPDQGIATSPNDAYPTVYKDQSRQGWVVA
jgi:hypothetical protein